MTSVADENPWVLLNRKKEAMEARLGMTGLKITKCVIKPPYCMVEVRYQNTLYVGFSKRSPRDTYDLSIGLNIALSRAMRLARSGDCTSFLIVGTSARG